VTVVNRLLNQSGYLFFGCTWIVRRDSPPYFIIVQIHGFTNGIVAGYAFMRGRKLPRPFLAILSCHESVPVGMTERIAMPVVLKPSLCATRGGICRKWCWRRIMRGRDLERLISYVFKPTDSKKAFAHGELVKHSGLSLRDRDLSTERNRYYSQ